MSHLEIQHDHAGPVSVHFGAKEIGWQALGPAIACTTVATGVVALRWYTRCRLASCLGLDDCVILFSLVSEGSPYCFATELLTRDGRSSLGA